MRSPRSVSGNIAALLLAMLFGAGLYHFDVVGRVAYAVERGRIAADRDHLLQVASQDVAALDSLSHAYSLVAEVIRPSVVNIHATTRLTDDDPRRRALREFLGRDDEDAPRYSFGAGSGVIYDEDGHVVTNNHVVQDAERIDVTLADGRRFKARLVGSDPMTDLAVIRITADRLHPARFGDSDQVKVGHVVLAVGSPFRLDQTVSHGIISAKGRNNVRLDIYYQDFLQTDAPINPGNSGGPLVNSRGEVIGINTAIATDSGGYQGVGFSIPSNKVRRITGQLIGGNEIVRGFIGVSINGLDDVVAETLGLNDARGALVTSVSSDSPAEKAGLKFGDVILEVDGHVISNPSALSDRIASTAPGTKVKVTVWRDGGARTFDITIGRQPEDFALLLGGRRSPDRPRPDDEVDEDATPKSARGTTTKRFRDLGMTVSTVSPDLRKEYGLRGIENGALVTSVVPTGDAFAAELRPGDVIVEVNKQRIRNVNDLERALTPEALDQGVRLLVKNRRGSYYLGLKSR